MGILNVTPDSFYDGNRYLSEKEIVERAQTITSEGADIIDIGVVSTRPGATLLAPDVEAEKLSKVVALVRRELPDAYIRQRLPSTLEPTSSTTSAAAHSTRQCSTP